MGKKIVIAGVGIAGATLIKKLQKTLRRHHDVELTVVDAQNYSAFVPLIHESALGIVAPDHITFPVRQLLRGSRQRFMQAKVTGLDKAKRLLKTDKGEVPYDMLVLALGSRTNYMGVAGAAEFSIPIKTLSDAMHLRARILDAAECAARLHPCVEREAQLHFVVVGGGFTGVEVSAQLADFFERDALRLYPELKKDEAKITLVHAGDRILPMLSELVTKSAEKRLQKLGVTVKTKAMVNGVSKNGATLADGTRLVSSNVIWTSGILAVGDLFADPTTLQKGRLPVKATLQMAEAPDVFVIGDLAAVTEGNGPHPQTAQAASQQVHLVARNIEALLKAEPLQAFYYQHKGDLVPIGHAWAVGEIFGIRIIGFIPWFIRRIVYLQGLISWWDRLHVLTDWVVRRFLTRDTTRL